MQYVSIKIGMECLERFKLRRPIFRLAQRDIKSRLLCIATVPVRFHTNLEDMQEWFQIYLRDDRQMRVMSTKES